MMKSLYITHMASTSCLLENENKRKIRVFFYILYFDISMSKKTTNLDLKATRFDINVPVSI